MRVATILSLLIALGLIAPVPAGGISVTGLIEREVGFYQTVACDGPPGESRARNVRCVAALPESNVRQEVAVDWISRGARVARDPFGNLVLRVDRDVLAAGEAFEVGWRARVRLKAAIHRVDATRLASPLAIPEHVLVRYLADGDLYGLDDPPMKEVAEEARAAAADPLDLAYRLNEIVRSRLHYERDDRWDPAPACFSRGTGSCSEYHFVFANLCRNAGVPVRYVGASALRSGDDDYVDTVFHRWSEVWLPGHGWYPIDVSRNDSEDGAPANSAFGCTAANLLELMRGDGSDSSLLGWSYVSDVRARPEGGAEIRTRRHILWSPAPAQPLPELPVATLIGR